MCSLICWIIGDFYAMYFYSTLRKPKINFIVNYKVSPGNLVVVIVTLLVGLVLMNEYNRFSNIGRHLGGTNLLTYYNLVRTHLVDVQNFQSQDDIYPQTLFNSLLIALSRNIAYSFLIIFTLNVYFHNEIKYKYLVPVVVYFPLVILTTSRSGFIEFFSFIFLIVVLVRYQANGWGFQNARLYFKMIIPIIALSLGFYGLGFIRSNGVGTMFNDEMMDSLSQYIGSSIFGLDYLINGHLPENGYFAQRTFPILYTILEKFGARIEYVPLHADFFSWKNGSSNVYTALRNPIIDFTVYGMLVSRIYLGFLYGLIFRYYVYSFRDIYDIQKYVLFPMFYVPLIFYFVTDLFYYFFNFDFIFTVIILIIINKLIIKKGKVLAKAVV
jgi:oligosaccharide repeat unit polymerase